MHKQKTTQLIALGIIASAGYLVSILINVFLANHMSVESYGIFNVAFGMLTFLSSIVLLGTGSAASRFIPDLFHNHKLAELTDYIEWNQRLISLTFRAAFFMAFCAFLASIMGHFLHVYRLEEYFVLSKAKDL